MEPITNYDETADDGVGPYEDEEEPEPVVAPPPPQPPKNKGGRPKKNPVAPGSTAAANAPAKLEANSPESWGSDAEQIWPLLLEWLRTGGATGSPLGPNAIRINIRRLSTSYAPGPPVPLAPPIEGEVVSGSEDVLPSDALREHIIDCYHLPLMKGPARYKVDFTWRHNGKCIRIGDFFGNAPGEIFALRQAADMHQRQREQAQNAVAGRMPAPQQPRYQPPQPGYPQQQSQQGYGFPYPSYGADQSEAYELARTREQLAATNARLEEAMKHIADVREGRIPATAAVAAPANDIASQVVETLIRLGVIKPGGAPAAAPVGVAAAPTPAAPVAPPVDPIAGIEAMISGFGRLKKMARMVDQLAGDAVEATAETISDTTTADEGLPWAAQPTGGKWPDGSDIRFAKKKGSNGIDWTGVLFENGWAGQKVMEVGESILKPIGEAAQKIMSGAGAGVVTQGAPPIVNDEHRAEVVNGIPTGAQEVPAS